MTAVAYEGHPPVSARRAPFIGPDGTYTRTGQTLAFILGCLNLAFVPATIAAALLYTHAETRFTTDPDGARLLVNWSWIALVIMPGLVAVAGLVGLVASLLQ
jgi:hypothetical protein